MFAPRQCVLRGSHRVLRYVLPIMCDHVSICPVVPASHFLWFLTYVDQRVSSILSFCLFVGLASFGIANYTILYVLECVFAGQSVFLEISKGYYIQGRYIIYNNMVGMGIKTRKPQQTKK